MKQIHSLSTQSHRTIASKIAVYSLVVVSVFGGSVLAQQPNLEATVEFMNRMVQPEQRQILPLYNTPNTNDQCTLLMISQQPENVWFPKIELEGPKKWEVRFRFLTDTDKDADVEFSQGRLVSSKFPRYMFFDLGRIDSASIESQVGGFGTERIDRFVKEHPECAETSKQCADAAVDELGANWDITVVSFRTTDLSHAIERGGLVCSDKEQHTGVCPMKSRVVSGTVDRATIIFHDKDRAERFVTAFLHAVELCGGQRSLFPPTPEKK